MKIERGISRVVIAMSLLAALMFGGTSAIAQTDPYGNGEPTVAPTLIIDESQPDEVLGTTETRGGGGEGPGVGDTAIETQAREPSGGVLPFTGGDLTLFVLIGAGAIATGAAIQKRAARKRV